MGEASHGSAEFYEMRARISQELIEKKGFNIIAIEADWPDANYINHYIHNTSPDPLLDTAPFSRFPTWMWANQSVLKFTRWLRDYNLTIAENNHSVGFYGLDLYSLNSSIEAVLNYLESVDPETAELARGRYGCLTPWAKDPAVYGQVMLTKQYKKCEKDVLATLRDLLKARLNYAHADGQRYFDAEQNARLVANAERYYRTLYYAEQNSWNQRDQHMFDTLQSILSFRGKNSKAIIWAHNSHVGDARSTQMNARGEFNIGQLVREHYRRSAYLIGFGTDHGTVAAASEWGVPLPQPMMEFLRLRLPAVTVRDAVLTGKRYAADDAIAAGFADGKAPVEYLLSMAIELATDLACKEPGIFKAIKQAYYAPIVAGLK